MNRVTRRDGEETKTEEEGEKKQEFRGREIRKKKLERKSGKFEKPKKNIKK